MSQVVFVLFKNQPGFFCRTVDKYVTGFSWKFNNDFYKRRKIETTPIFPSKKTTSTFENIVGFVLFSNGKKKKAKKKKKILFDKRFPWKILPFLKQNRKCVYEKKEKKQNCTSLSWKLSSSFLFLILGVSRIGWLKR